MLLLPASWGGEAVAAAATARGEGAERAARASLLPRETRGPYLGPPRLGPRAARGRGMAPGSSNVPTSGERAERREAGARGARRSRRGGAEGTAVGGGWPEAGGGGGGSAATARVFRAWGGGKGKGTEGRGGEVGREPPPRARAGRRRRRCRSAHSSLFGGHFVCVPQGSARAAGLGRGGEVGGANGLGGGARHRLGASAEGAARGCRDLNCGRLGCLHTLRFDIDVAHRGVCAHVQFT